MLKSHFIHACNTVYVLFCSVSVLQMIGLPPITNNCCIPDVISGVLLLISDAVCVRVLHILNHHPFTEIFSAVICPNDFEVC